MTDLKEHQGFRTEEKAELEKEMEKEQPAV